MIHIFVLLAMFTPTTDKNNHVLWASATIALRACRTNPDLHPVLPSGDKWVAIDCKALLGFANKTPDYFIEEAKDERLREQQTRDLINQMQKLHQDLIDGIQKAVGK